MSRAVGIHRSEHGRGQRWRPRTATSAATVGHVAPSQRSQMATWKSTTGSGRVAIAIGIIALGVVDFYVHSRFLVSATWVPRVVTSSLLSPSSSISRPLLWLCRLSLLSRCPATHPVPVVIADFLGGRGWVRTTCRRSLHAPDASPGIPSKTSRPDNNCVRYACRGLRLFLAGVTRIPRSRETTRRFRSIERTPHVDRNIRETKCNSDSSRHRNEILSFHRIQNSIK